MLHKHSEEEIVYNSLKYRDRNLENEQCVTITAVIVTPMGVLKFLKTVMMPTISTGKKIKKNTQSVNKPSQK